MLQQFNELCNLNSNAAAAQQVLFCNLNHIPKRMDRNEVVSPLNVAGAAVAAAWHRRGRRAAMLQ